MPTRGRVSSFVRSYGLWAGVMVVPLLINGVVWATLVLPQQKALRSWRESQELAGFKPELEALLAEGHRTLMDWERTGFVAGDPAAVTQAIQQIAGRHRIHVTGIETKAGAEKTERVAGYSTVALDVKADGHFSKLAHWMSELEAQSGLQVDSWTITAADESGKPHELTVSLTAFLREG